MAAFELLYTELANSEVRKHLAIRIEAHIPPAE